MNSPQFSPFRRASRQEKLYQAKLESLELFVRVTAHDLNGPLTGMNLNLQACRRVARSQNMHRLLDAIENDLSTATGLLEELKSLNRREIYRLQQVDLQAELQSFIGQTAGLKDLPVIVQADLASERLLIAGDSIRLKRVWQNIYRNTLEATESRTPFAPSILTISCRRRGSHARVQFADNAGGVSKNRIARIFEPFYTTKGEQNRGLGLFIARKIVTEHQGKIRIVSRKPVTRISIDLPLIQ